MENKNNKLTLHDAIVIVLSECQNKTATFEYVSSEIARRRLYFKKRLGGFADKNQIRARASKPEYSKLFDVVHPNRVRLK